MDVSTTAIPEVRIFTPQRFDDERGYFLETFAAARLAEHAPGLTFVQDNESLSRHRFTLRGLHYQAPPHAQDKLVRVARGAVWDVVVDVRKGSPTYAQWVGVELSADNRRQILAPKGFLHGFMTLEPDTIVSYKVTAPYHGPSDGAVYWASPDLAIDWPADAGAAIVSAKDAAAPRFADFASPFVFTP